MQQFQTFITEYIVLKRHDFLMHQKEEQDYKDWRKKLEKSGKPNCIHCPHILPRPRPHLVPTHPLL